MNTNQVNKGYLYSIVLVAVLGGLLFGYDTAVISGAEKGLQAFFLGAADFQYTDFMHGLTCSSALIGCVIGALISGWMANRMGRKRTLFVAGILFFVFCGFVFDQDRIYRTFDVIEIGIVLGFPFLKFQVLLLKLFPRFFILPSRFILSIEHRRNTAVLFETF